MEIHGDAILRLVQAARELNELDESLSCLFTDGLHHITVVTNACGKIVDALSRIAGERFDARDDFCQSSQVLKMLNNEHKEDMDVVGFIIGAAATTQPAPKFIDRDAMRRQAEHGNGYMYKPRYPREETPEGEWT